MFCINCGQQLPDNSVFCNICGTRLAGRQENNAAVPHMSAQGYNGAQGYNNAPGYNSAQGYNAVPGYGAAQGYNGAPGYGSAQGPVSAPGYGSAQGPVSAPGYGNEKLSFDGASRYNAAPSYNQVSRQDTEEKPKKREASRAERTEVTQTPDGTYASRLVLLYYLVGLVVIVCSIAQIDYDKYSAILGFLYLIPSIAAIVADRKELRRCGYKLNPVWSIIGVVFSAPYLFVRAVKTKTGMMYFILKIIPTVIVIIVYTMILSNGGF
ncbi:MAG: zinc ribbon domain-containing protein [Butyrivibrio sp.]|nr:zinc ribbon domain-containing protein [Butyrivibrio sp.]